MEVNTASVSGFLRFWLLAKLRAWRPRSYRYGQEQQAIDAWLVLIEEATRLSGDLALEIAECARLIKGYGDTWKRGTGNYQLIETRIIRPVLAGAIPCGRASTPSRARGRQLFVDPEGEALTHCLADLDKHKSMSIAAE